MLNLAITYWPTSTVGWPVYASLLVAHSTEFDDEIFLQFFCWQADEREQKARDYMRAEVNTGVLYYGKKNAVKLCVCISKLSVSLLSLLPIRCNTVLITGRISHLIYYAVLCYFSWDTSGLLKT